MIFNRLEYAMAYTPNYHKKKNQAIHYRGACKHIAYLESIGIEITYTNNKNEVTCGTCLNNLPLTLEEIKQLEEKIKDKRKLEETENIKRKIKQEQINRRYREQKSKEGKVRKKYTEWTAQMIGNGEEE